MRKEFRRRFFSEKVQCYWEEIVKRNHKSFDSFALVGGSISVLVLVFGLIMDHVVTFNTEFFVIFCYFVAMLLVSRLFLKRHQRYSTAAFYIALTPLMVIGILMGTFLDTSQPSITIMVFLCVLPIFLLDKPWRVVAYITGTALVYTVCCYLAKDFHMFVADMIDLIMFYFLAVGVNCFSLHDRISSVENFIKFKEKSETDLLTGIYNRGAGVERIEALLQQNTPGAFIVLDIDDFKGINDRFGHLAGDELLRRTARLLKEAFPAGDDVILRLGGDEFAIYVPGMTEQALCAARFEALMGKLKGPQEKQPDAQPTCISLGCAISVSGNIDFEQLYKDADISLYEAKNRGKGCYVIRER